MRGRVRSAQQYWPIAIFWGIPPRRQRGHWIFSLANIHVVPQVGCMSEDLCTLVALFALVCITQCKSRNIGILQHFWGSSYHQRYLRVFLHVAHSCGSSGCEHGCRPSYTSCICCVGVWEQQYWPIGGSPDQGNYLKAYSHTVWYSHRQGFEKESFGL